jgi:hypothetical protein
VSTPPADPRCDLIGERARVPHLDLGEPALSLILNMEGRGAAESQVLGANVAVDRSDASP